MHSINISRTLVYFFLHHAEFDWPYRAATTRDLTPIQTPASLCPWSIRPHRFLHSKWPLSREVACKNLLHFDLKLTQRTALEMIPTRQGPLKFEILVTLHLFSPRWGKSTSEYLWRPHRTVQRRSCSSITANLPVTVFIVFWTIF